MSSFNSVEFGKNIKKRRQALGYSQLKLAEMLDISSNHLSSIETGKSDFSINVLIKLCDVLNVTPDYILLGNMHSDNIPKDIYDTAKLCSEEDQKSLYQIAKIFQEKSNYKQ